MLGYWVALFPSGVSLFTFRVCMPVPIDIQYWVWAGCGCVIMMLLKAPYCPCIPNNIKTSACQSDHYLPEPHLKKVFDLTDSMIHYLFTHHQNRNGYTTAHYSIFYLKTKLIFLLVWKRLKIPTWDDCSEHFLLNVYIDMMTAIIIHLL